MSKKIQAIRGMNDILPTESYFWQFVEKTFSDCISQYGYHEIRFPIVESTQLFKRSIGEVTDIVEKEMYSFNDLNGDGLTLRPEGTAGCVRACIQNGLLHNQQQKLWYSGPMFRHEKPQKGRYRQFHQFGVEAFGYDDVGIELELIILANRFWQMLGIAQNVELQINTLGTTEERNSYVEKLVAYFHSQYEKLDEDSQRRLEKNPLRILDSKNPEMQSIIHEAPKLFDSLREESQRRFQLFCKGLTDLGISYSINPQLVRGLDYYGHTVFEWVTDKLGSQSAVCAGGRYDGLVEQVGGKPTPAAGFGLGVERLILLLSEVSTKQISHKKADFYIICQNENVLVHAIELSEKIRNVSTSLSVETNLSFGSLKSQFKKADKSGAMYALVLGDEEVSTHTIGLKYLREDREQTSLKYDELEPFIKNNCLR